MRFLFIDYCLSDFIHRKLNIKKFLWFFFLFIFLLAFLLGCSPATTNQTTDKSGNELLYFAEQYRNISNLMSNKYVEQDYDSISSLLVVAVGIAQNVEELNVSKKYEQARNYAEDWMYSDAYWFHLAISNDTNGEMNKVFNESMEYLTLFVGEMERLGHNIN